jgi:hypothetical protein
MGRVTYQPDPGHQQNKRSNHRQRQRRLAEYPCHYGFTFNECLTQFAYAGRMTKDRQPRLDDAFERIEETILPCLSMLLEAMLDAAAGVAKTDPDVIAAELRMLASEVEQLTTAVSRSQFLPDGRSELQYVA